MRALIGKELREMRIALVALALAGVAIGFVLKVDNDVAMGMIVAVGLLGLPLGVFQGRLDRRAVADEFLLHRPMSAKALHQARTVAGAAAALALAAVPLAVMFLVPYRRGLPVFGALVDEAPSPQWNDMTAGRVAFAVLLSLAMWSVGRLGASARTPLASMFGAVLLPATLGWALVRVAGTPEVAALYTSGALVVTLLAGRELLALKSAGRSAS